MIVCLIMFTLHKRVLWQRSKILLHTEGPKCLPWGGEVAVLRLRVDAQAGYFVQG